MNSNKKENLTNKFNMAEMSVESEIKYKQIEDFYDQVKLEEKIQFSWVDTIARSFKLLFKFFFDVSAKIWAGVIRPLGRFLAKSISAGYVNLKNGKNKKEIVIDKYLKEVESKIDLQEAILRVKEIEISNSFQEYESKIKKTFSELLCNVTLNSDKEEFGNSTKSLAFGQELLAHMSLKLQESFLQNNIDYINVTGTVDKNEMAYVVEMELKNNGSNWASVFSKFVLNEVYKKTESYGGKISGQHIENVTLKRDTFILVVSYQKLEILELALKPTVLQEQAKEILNFDLDVEEVTVNHPLERTQDI